jgi:hypothetical protein
VSFTATLVGDGPLRGAIQKHIAVARLQDSMHLTGALPEDEVTRLLRKADVLVQPSVVASDGQMEGIPVSLMEAMATGVPVIASNISGIPELVRPGVTGWLVPPGEPEALAGALKQVGRPHPGLQDMRSAARRHVEQQHSLDRCVGQLLKCIDGHRLPLPPRWSERLHDFPTAGSQAVLALQDRRDSWIARLAPAPGLPERIVKGHSPRSGASRLPAVRARYEYDVLVALGNDPPPRGCGVPRAIACQGSRLVLEAAPGEPLEQLLRRARRTGPGGLAALRAALRAMYRCGRWLRWFQHRSLPEPPGEQERDNASDFLRAVERDTLTCRDLLRRAPARQLTTRFRTLASHLTLASLRCGPRHGDFGPVNVLADRNLITVLDFEGAGLGPPLQDIGHFLVHAGQFFCYPRLAAKGRLLEHAFMDGYLDGEMMDPAALLLGRMAAACRLLAVTGAGAGSPAARWRARHLRRLIGTGADS